MARIARRAIHVTTSAVATFAQKGRTPEPWSASPADSILPDRHPGLPEFDQAASIDKRERANESKLPAFYSNIAGLCCIAIR